MIALPMRVPTTTTGNAHRIVLRRLVLFVALVGHTMFVASAAGASAGGVAAAGVADPVGAASAVAVSLPQGQRVAFGSLDRDAKGRPVLLTGLLFVPARTPPPDGHPAIVALHGCGGMYSAARGREGRLSQHNEAWVRQLLGQGYAVLFPDSFNPRGRREICTVRAADRTIKAMTRRQDAMGALAWVAVQPGIDRERIGLIGFSHGGTTTLATINRHDPALAAWAGASGERGGLPSYRAAVAYYPGCRSYLRAGAAWQPAVPTQIHIGASDDWTPAAPCVELGEEQAARGSPLTVDVYPDSFHGFDSPGRHHVVRRDVASGVNPSAGVTLATNPEAAALAWQRVVAFLDEQLAPRPRRVTPIAGPLP